MRRARARGARSHPTGVFQHVMSAAIGTTGAAGLGDGQKYAGMRVPQTHAVVRSVLRLFVSGVFVLILGIGFDGRLSRPRRRSHLTHLHLHLLHSRCHGPGRRRCAADGSSHHLSARLSHFGYSRRRPCTWSKKVDCSFSVMGPRLPRHRQRPSTSRMGVTSAAVPVKKASSAIYTSSRVMRFSRTSIPMSSASRMIVARVMPSSAEVSSGV